MEKYLSFILSNIYNSHNKNKDFIITTTNSIFRKEVILANLTDLKEFNEELFIHSLKVLMYSLLIGSTLKFNNTEMYELGVSAVLHKVGKTFVNVSDIEIVEKTNAMNYSKYIIECFVGKIPKTSLTALLDYNERFDGQGVLGKKGTEISKYGRIIAISNIYHSLLSLHSPSDSLEYLFANVDTIFDIDIIKGFYLSIALYPTNSEILLSNGQLASVQSNNPGFPSRPTIILNNELIDLSKDKLNLVVAESKGTWFEKV